MEGASAQAHWGSSFRRRLTLRIVICNVSIVPKTLVGCDCAALRALLPSVTSQFEDSSHEKALSLGLLLSLFTLAAFGASTFERVLIYGSTVKEGPLLGSGIETSPELSAGSLTDSRQNPIVWRITRDSIDDLGMRHVFYQQALVTAAGDALIVGTDVGLHYSKHGELRSAMGHQVTELAIANAPRFGLAVASERILASVRRTTPTPIKAGELKVLTDATLIVLTQDGISRLAYESVLEDGASLPYRVAVDAATEEILRIVPEFAAGNCQPTTPVSISSATGVPLRSADGVPNRALSANATGGRPTWLSSLRYEAYEPSQWNMPRVLTFQQTEDSAFVCGVSPAIPYTLFPLRSSAGTPTYDDFGDGWRGREAADAIHHTVKTMEAFRTLGRNGWDGSGSDASIVVDAYLYGEDNAIWNQVATSWAPQGVVVFRRNVIEYGVEAALDVMAHEWGHGVIYTHPGIPYAGDARQMHEGFADVIGHIVEKMMQPAGAGVERSSDWDIGEDAGLPAVSIRTANADDGAGGNRYHRDDSNHLGTPHAIGHMLSVAFYVLSEGGTNPWCINNSTAYGCTAGTPGLGVEPASRVMFRALTHYMNTTSDWDDLADHLKFAAADLYHNCNATVNRNAEWEQDQVEQAFLSIGYPSGLGNFEFCPL